MGSITRSFANNITTSGVLLPASLTNNSIANVTAYNAAIATGNMVLISSQTASNSASISFTTGINSTYKEYQFWFENLVPVNNSVQFGINFSTDGGSTYSVTKTSSFFQALHYEDDSNAYMGYRTENDLAQSTAIQLLTFGVRTSNADEGVCGTLNFYNPSSTTYVKHYIADTHSTRDWSHNVFCSGYCNTTSAVNAVKFQYDSGNISTGTILMYGIV
jgi:hypothetical protein